MRHRATPLHRPLVLALAGLLAAAGCGLWDPGPERTAIRFYRALDGGQVETALALVDPASFEELPEDKVRALFERVAEEMAKAGGLSEVEVTEVHREGDAARVTVRLVTGDGESELQQLQLHRTEQGWRIDFRGELVK